MMMSSFRLVQRIYLLWVFAIVFGILLLVTDIWTKQIAYAYFTKTIHPNDIEVWHNWWGIDFTITYVPNRGAAWGLLAEWQGSLLVLRVVAVTCLMGYLCLGKARSAQILPLTLIAAGAIGNIVDTFTYGYVVDILLFTFWSHDFAVFNLADSAITLGVIILIIQTYFYGDVYTPLS